MEQDAIARAYFRMDALKKNIPQGPGVRRNLVEEYHAALTALAGGGFDVQEFRIPESAFYLDNFDDPFVSYPLFMAKIDFALGYFAHRGVNKIDFTGPRK